MPKVPERYSAGQIERWRGKIQVGMMLDVLNKVAKGEIRADKARLKAIEIGLRKTIPDLQSIAFTGDANVRFTWGSADPQTIDVTPTEGVRDPVSDPDNSTDGENGSK